MMNRQLSFQSQTIPTRPAFFSHLCKQIWCNSMEMWHIRWGQKFVNFFQSCLLHSNANEQITGQILIRMRPIVPFCDRVQWKWGFSYGDHLELTDGKLETGKSGHSIPQSSYEQEFGMKEKSYIMSEVIWKTSFTIPSKVVWNSFYHSMALSNPWNCSILPQSIIKCQIFPNGHLYLTFLSSTLC